LTWKPHESLADTRAFLRGVVNGATAFHWVITKAEDAGLLGMISLEVRGHAASLGYVLARAEWGKGYMTEAAQAVVDLALSLPGVYRVWAVCDVENLASARVMQKVGLLQEGIMRRYLVHPALDGEPRDVYLYARTQ
jgi:RimJ/RimL family protein N-acetyltransferase